MIGPELMVWGEGAIPSTATVIALALALDLDLDLFVVRRLQALAVVDAQASPSVYRPTVHPSQPGRAAGELEIPFTAGILVGIGESRQDRLDAIRSIAASDADHGHVQEVIVQNFLPKTVAGMRHAPAGTLNVVALRAAPMVNRCRQ